MELVNHIIKVHPHHLQNENEEIITQEAIQTREDNTILVSREDHRRDQHRVPQRKYKERSMFQKVMWKITIQEKVDKNAKPEGDQDLVHLKLAQRTEADKMAI